MGKKLFVMFALFLLAAAGFAAGAAETVAIDTNIKVHGTRIVDIQNGDVLNGWYVCDSGEAGVLMRRYEYDKKNKHLIEYTASVFNASFYHMFAGLNTLVTGGESPLPDREGYVYEGLDYTPTPLNPYETMEEEMLDDKHIYAVQSMILSYDGAIPKHLKVIDADGNIQFEGKVEKSK